MLIQAWLSLECRASVSTPLRTDPQETPMDQKMSYKKEFFLASLLGVLFFLGSLPFATVGVDAHHDGVMLKPAADVARGAVIHRDTFTQYGPATTLVQAKMLQIFGFELRVLRYTNAVCYGITVAFLCLFWRFFLPWSLVTVSVLWLTCAVYFFRPYWVLEPWSSGMALCAESAALLLLSLSCRTLNRWSRCSILFSAGAIVSVVFFFRQPVGAVLSIAAALVPLGVRLLEVECRQTGVGFTNIILKNLYLWSYVTGGMVFAVMFFSWLWVNGAMQFWYEQNVVWPRKFAGGYFNAYSLYKCFATSEVVLPLSLLLSTVVCAKRLSVVSGRLRLVLLIFVAVGWLVACVANPRLLTLVVLDKLIPLACVPLLLLRFFRAGQRPPELVLPMALAVSAMSSWAQFYPVPCIRHLFWGVAPIIGVFVFLVWKQFAVSARSLATILVVFVFPLAIVRLTEAREHLAISGSSHPVAGPLCGMRPYKDDFVQPGRGFRQLGYEADLLVFEEARNALVRRYGQSPIVLYGVDALWCVLTESRENAGPFYVSWPDLQEFGIYEERARAIRSREWPVIAVQDAFLNGGRLELLADCGYEQFWSGDAFGGTVRLYGRISD